MSDEKNPFPVFTVLHEERTISVTIPDKEFFNGNKAINLESESKELKENALTRIGTGYMQKDGSIYIQLFAIPLNGKVVIKATNP